MNEAIELALRTWYPKNHPLHLDPIHPAMGLVGEIGEWINKHKKDKFKSGFKFAQEDQLDELGDIWYYLRILAYQFGVKNFVTFYDTPAELAENSLDYAMASFPEQSSKILSNILMFKDTEWFKCNTIISYGIVNICEDLDFYLVCGMGLSLNKLTALNWEKLKPGSERGKEWTNSW